ncbi:hypothetical protein D3C87_233940 [compost metagenome]
MKKLLDLGIFKLLVCCFVVVGQSTGCFGQIVTSSSKKLSQSGGLRSGKILSYIENELIYFTPATVDKASDRFIYVIDLNGLKQDSISIQDKKRKGIGLAHVVQFAVSGKSLVILSSDLIYFYRRVGRSFVFERSIKNTYSFSGMERLGNNFLLYVCYPFHPLDQKETNVWAKLDLSKQEIVDVHFPEIDNTKFGNLVNSWVSTCEGTIAHASSSEYKVIFYDENYLRVDSIVMNSDTLFRVDMDFLEQFDLRSKTGISKFMESDAQKLTRIRKVFLLDNNQLAVLSKLSKDLSPPYGKARLDVWEKNPDGWKLKSQVLGDDMYRDGEVYNEQHVFLGNLYQNVFDLKISNGQIYSVSFPYYPKVITEGFDRGKDIDSYFKDSTGFYYGL